MKIGWRFPECSHPSLGNVPPSLAPLGLYCTFRQQILFLQEKGALLHIHILKSLPKDLMEKEGRERRDACQEATWYLNSVNSGAAQLLSGRTDKSQNKISFCQCNSIAL